MPQENGSATGPEYVDNPEACPYCGSEDLAGSGIPESQLGQLVASNHCASCGKEWRELFSIVGWYDESENLHEDTRTKDLAERFREALMEIVGVSANENSEPDRMGDALGEIQGIVRRVLEERTVF